ncbi:hypothetical protein GCM10020254_77510 [Streptomyces goshikiensis]
MWVGVESIENAANWPRLCATAELVAFRVRELAGQVAGIVRMRAAAARGLDGLWGVTVGNDPNGGLRAEFRNGGPNY